MKTEKNTTIPRATAKRLSLYYRIFKRFNAEKIEKQTPSKSLKLLALTLLLSDEIFLISVNLAAEDLVMMSRN